MTRVDDEGESLRQWNERLSAILSTAPSLFRRHELAELAETILGRAAALMGAPHGCLYLLEPGSPELKRRVAIGRYREEARPRIARGQDLAGRVWETVQALSEPGGSGSDDPLGSLSRLAVPLRSPDGMLGILELGRPEPDPFGAADVDTLARFAQLAAMAIEAARLYEAVTLELTERRRVEEELQAERDFALQVMSRMAQGLVVTDAEGRLEYVNPAFARLLGTPAASLVGKTLGELSRKGAWAHQQTPLLRPGDHTGNQEVELLRGDGSSTPAALTLAPRFKEGRVAGAIGVVTDLTERLRTEQALLAAKEAAQAASEAKTEFVARLSHEVRTPVQAIIGYCDILLDQLPDLDRPRIREGLERLREAGTHLVSVAGGALNLSRIEAGHVAVAIQEFDAATLARQAADAAAPLVERHGSQLEVVAAPDAGSMRSDPGLVRQVLLNLLSNAGKFTRQGKVTLRVRRERSGSAETVCFDVEDTGVGIAPEQMDRLFTEYAQLSGSGDAEGSGLGLSICRRLCRLLGGDVAVESRRGEGSLFSARLPAHAPQAGSDASRPPAQAGSADRSPSSTVLIIDGPAGATSPELPAWLTDNGFQVETGAPGDDCLRLLRELRPDVLVVHVETGTGLPLQRPELASVPVVALCPAGGPGGTATPPWASERLELPLDRAATARLFGKYRPQAGSGGSRGHALVVDDDLAARTILRRMLEPEGFHVTDAHDGRVALAHLAERRPDVVLLDLMMPGVDGFEILRGMRESERLKDVPIVVISAMELSRAQSLQLGPQARHVFLKGSYTRADLVRVLGELVPPQA